MLYKMQSTAHNVTAQKIFKNEVDLHKEEIKEQFLEQ